MIDPSMPQAKQDAVKIAKLAAELTEINNLTRANKSSSENAAAIFKLEKELDMLVFDLYGLTADERKIVEDAVK